MQLPWNDIAVTELDNRYLKIYGYQPRHAYDKKALRWYKWANDMTAHVHDLPLFAALVSAILSREQSSVQQERIQNWKTMAVAAKRLQKRRTILLVSSTITIIICLLTALTFSLISYSNQQDQRAARDLLLIQNRVKMLAQHPYYAAIPGEKCDHGQGNWIDDDDTNSYDCLPDGLYMIQKNMQYQDETYFNFDKATDATTDTGLLFTGQFVPHHYQLQVKASMVSGGPDTCVAIHFHIHQFMGRQEFDVCADNTWSYSYCDLQCDNDVQVASGNLPQNETSPYLITVDATDNVKTLYVDHTKIASMKDSRYTKTDEIALGVYGDEDGTPSAVFADFRYAPFIQP